MNALPEIISKRPPFFYYFILSVAADDSFITLKYDRCAGKNEIKVWPAPNNKELMLEEVVSALF